jgi:hypothetical protein
MVQNRELAAGAVWPDALFLIAGVAILVAAISFLARRLRGTWADGPDAELIRREMLDECFAKGEMSREECEGRCQGLGHPGERPRLPPSAPANLQP